MVVVGFVGAHEASTSPCLIFCPLVRKVWNCIETWSCLKKWSMLSFLDCAISLRNTVSKKDFELFVMYNWVIWKEICRYKHEQNKQHFMIKD